MGTTSEKLTYLNGTKQLLKDKINNLGGSIDDNTTFRNYANQLQNVYDNYPKTEYGEGTSITLENCNKGKLDYDNGVVGIGQSSQESTTGKNLLNYIDNLNTNTSGLTSTINDDGSITTTGKPTSDYVALISYDITSMLENGERYYISQKSLQTNLLFLQVNIKDNATQQTTICSLNSGTSNSFVADTTNKTYRMKLQTDTMANWGADSRTITNFYQLEKGSSATSFEKYTGGQASPNPSYPQEIKYVRGKNLYNKDITPEPYYYNADGVKTPAGSGTYINQEYSLRGAVTISFTQRTGDSYVRICEYNGSTFIKRTLVDTASTTILDNRTNRVIFSTDEYENAYFTNLQIEEGTQATPYLPYNTIEEVVRGKNVLNFVKWLENVRAYGQRNGNTGMGGGTLDSYTDNSFTYTASGNDCYSQSFTMNGTASVNKAFCELYPHLVFEVEPSTYYTLSFKRSDETLPARPMFFYLDENYNYLSLADSGSLNISSFARQTPSNCKYMLFRIGLVGNSGVSMTLSNLQLEKGNAATNYEPYKTPKTYQFSLGDYKFYGLGDYKDTIRRSSGKNLLPWGTITGNTTTEYTFNPALEAGAYSFSFNAYNPNGGKALDFLNANNTSIKNVYMPQHTTKTHQFVTFTVAEPISKIRIYSGSAVDEVSEIMLVKGEYTQVTMPDYEPYGVGVWFKYGVIREKIFTGASDESWSNGDYGTNSYKVSVSNIQRSNASTIDMVLCMSNIFKGITYNTRTVSGNNVIYSDLDYSAIYVRNTSYTSLADFKTMLSTNNMIAIYVLATPTIDIITGTLAEQLEAWWNGLSNNGTTIITSNGNLPMIIKVRGLKGE